MSHAEPAAPAPAALPAQRRALGATLWIVQVLLALLFLFAGSMKFIMPAEEMTRDSPLPLWFLYFIGVAELLGGLGLILPGLVRVMTFLTPLAAAGLVIIMIGATWTTVVAMGPGPAMMPLVVGLLSAFVAYGRWKLAPLGSRRPSP